MGDFYSHYGPLFLESLETPDGVEREGLFLPCSLSFAEQDSQDTLYKVLGLLFGLSVPTLVRIG